MTLIFIQCYTSIFKLVAKKPEIIFIYFVKIHDFIIIQDAEVFIENVFLSQSLIIPVLPPRMDEVRGGHLLGKELLLLLNIFEMQDVVERKRADCTIDGGRLPVLIITRRRCVKDVLYKLPPTW